MHKAINYGTDGWGNIPDLYFNKMVAVSHNVPIIDDKVKYNVLSLMEPESVVSIFSEEILNKFDLIITWRKDILEKYKNSVKMIFGSCWINQDELSFNKKNKISYLMSNKRSTNGHIFRYFVYNCMFDRPLINDLQTTCIMTPPRITSKSEILDEYKFSVIVENEKLEDWITEKLIDCFATKTVPIYWGAPNASEYFDKNGIIQFDNIDDLNKILDNLTSNDYDSRLSAIEKNFQLSKDYWSYWDRVQSIINTELFRNV